MVRLTRDRIQGKPEWVVEGFTQVVHRVKWRLGIIWVETLARTQVGGTVPILFTSEPKPSSQEDKHNIIQYMSCKIARCWAWENGILRFS